MTAPTGRQRGGDIMQMFEGPGEETLDEASRAMLAQAREAFRELEKLTKNIALYGRTHQSVTRFQQRLFAAITDLIGTADRIEFQIGPYDFTMLEQSVYQNPNPERNFVYRFYLDGVRHILIYAGVTADELGRFVDILLTDWDDPALFEDDSVTLLWQADFENIQYVLIDNFDEDVREGEERMYTVAGVVDQVREGLTGPSPGPPRPPSPPPSSRGGPPPPPPPPGAVDPSGARDRGRSARRVDLSAAGLTEANLARFVETPFAMDEAEFHTLERVIHTHGRETLEKFIEILFKVNLSEDAAPGDRAGRIVGLFDRIADLLLGSGRLGELERLMRKVRRLTGPRGVELPENLRTITRMFAHWSEPEFAARVLQPLVSDAQSRYAPSILAICGLLEPTAIVPIARAAGAVRAEDAQAALYRLTARMLPGQERAVIELLKEAEPDHAHELFRLLTTVGDARLRPAAARAAMANPEPKVRFEGLSILPSATDPKVLDLMFAALDDPARMVRSKAIHLIARMRRPEVHRRVMSCIDGKGFAEFDLAEKRRYFAAAALTGDPRARCQALFEGGGLIRSRGQDELRHCAAVALSIRLQRDVIPLFEKEQSRRLKSELVLEAVGWGLRHMQSDRDERTRQLYDIFFKGELAAASEQGDG